MTACHDSYMTPIKTSHADKTVAIPGADSRLTLRRRLIGYAYPRNGNVHNPTPEYQWELMVGSRCVDMSPLARRMIDAARTNGPAYIAEVDAA